MPWGLLIKKVLSYVMKTAPRGGRVLDLMCGPGYLLSKLQARRKDLYFTGVDIDPRYVRYAKKKYPKIEWMQADSVRWESKKKFDIILCTGGLHHLPYTQHKRFLQKLSHLITKNGVCIVADPYIAPYRTEKDRRLAAAKLGSEYLEAVLLNNAPDDMVSASIDIMHNDILPHGEYKTYPGRIQKLSARYFSSVKHSKTWPKSKSEYGDYIFYFKNPVR